MKAMTKLLAQLEMVDSAIPFARARSGKISAPSNQGVGPQLKIPAVSASAQGWREGSLRSAKDEKIEADGSKNAVCGRNTCVAKREGVGMVLQPADDRQCHRERTAAEQEKEPAPPPVDQKHCGDGASTVDERACAGIQQRSRYGEPRPAKVFGKEIKDGVDTIKLRK